MAWIGERDTRSESSFKPAGLMVGQAPASITQVDITQADSSGGVKRWKLARHGLGWQQSSDTGEHHQTSIKLAPQTLSDKVEQALELLHGAAPERLLSGDELSLAASFGLSPPRLHIVARGTGPHAKPFGIAFGRTTTMELAHYAQVDGAAEVAIVPRHVADAWESIVNAP